MASFIILNRQAFDANPLEEFRRVAGDLPSNRKGYDSRDIDKGKLVWNFFKSNLVTDRMLDAKTVYSGDEEGCTIRELIDRKNDNDKTNNIHSLEHVVPKSKLIARLEDVLTEDKVNGATINPLNLVPSHRVVNSQRGNRVFDFDGDRVKWQASSKVDKDDEDSRKFQAGSDKTEAEEKRDKVKGEWVISELQSRGDLARCIMYMELMYGLKYVSEKQMRQLQEWMKDDKPSDYERKFGLWLRQTRPYGMNVQNPFVTNPELVTNEMFEKLLSAYLASISNKPEPPTNNNDNDKEEEPPIVIIDTVLANPSDFDGPGTERITLRNTSGKVVDLNGWTLSITTSVRNNNSTWTFGRFRLLDTATFGFGREFRLLNTANFGFGSSAPSNVLSNNRTTTIMLRDKFGNMVSEFKYSRSDARAGEVIPRSRL